MHGFRRSRPHRWFAAAGLAFGLAIACKWSGLFGLATCIVIVAAIRLMQGWRTQFADGNADDWYRPNLWPDFRWTHFVACFVIIPTVVYLATFVPVFGWSIPDILGAQRRIFNDNTTSAIAGHTYMSSWPSWPLLVRAGLVSLRQDRRGSDRGGGLARQSAGVVAGAAGACGDLARLDRGTPRGRVPDPVVLCRAVSCLGAAAARAQLPVLYLPSAMLASLALVYVLRRGNTPRWLLWAFVALAFAGFVVMLPIAAAFVGTSMQTFNRLMIFQNWI
jgi:dolichyl-phosphate-mannose-protein mannosyltransferase